MRVLSASGRCVIHRFVEGGGSPLAECTFSLAAAPGAVLEGLLPSSRDGRTEGDNAQESVRLHACSAKHSGRVSCDSQSEPLPGGRKS